MFEILERGYWLSGDHYTTYKFLNGGFISCTAFENAINSLNGYVYGTCVGVVNSATIFNGSTWIGIHGTGSYEENDVLIEKFKRALRKEIKCV